MAALTPQKIGKYTILDRVAAGGMAELCRALITGDRGFEKLVAIKRLLPHLTDEESVVTSFIDEAKLAALLQHRNIVQIYDFGSMEDSYFIAMEYLSGKDLHALLKACREQGRRLELEHALCISLQICEGLDYAHRLKDLQGKPLHIIHRDVSPQNIFINYDGEVKLIDFGIAKAASQSAKTQMGTIKGKVAYMSPEQAEGRPIDHRSDIFASGILLYEMVTGTRMFHGDAMEVLAKVRETRFTPAESMAPDLPSQLYGILHKALAADPDDRYETSGGMAEDLENCIHRNGLRPTSQGLSRVMKDVFEDDRVTEELTIQEITRTRLPPAGLQSETEASAVKTAVLSAKELPGRSRIPRKGLAGAGLVLVVLLVCALLYRGGGDTVSPSSSKPSSPPSALKKPAAPPPPPARRSEPSPLEAGRKALEEKRYEEAAVRFASLLEADPALAETLAEPYEKALLGQAAAFRDTNPQRAERILQQAVDINPRGVQSRFQLGLLYVKTMDYPKAVSAFEDAARLDPSFPDTYFNLGYVYAMNRDYGKAEEMYRRVVELAPMYLDEAYFNLAMVQEKEGKQKECLLNLEQAMTVNPANQLARKNLKRLRAKAGTP